MHKINFKNQFKIYKCNEKCFKNKFNNKIKFVINCKIQKLYNLKNNKNKLTNRYVHS